MAKLTDIITYPLQKLKYSMGGFAIFSIFGIIMALNGNPGFIIGAAIGFIIVFLVLILYRLSKQK